MNTPGPSPRSTITSKAAAETLLLIGVLRESFVATLPFIILSSATTLFLNLLSWQGFALSREFFGIAAVFEALFPAAITISISYHLGRRYGINHFMTVLQAIVVSAAVSFIYHETGAVHIQLLSASFLRALVVPILSTVLLRVFITLPIKSAATRKTLTNPIREVLRYIFPFMAAFVVAVAFFAAIKPILSTTFFSLQVLRTGLSGEGLLICRTLFSHLLWYIGLHGDNSFDLLLNNNRMSDHLFGELSLKEFFDLFVVHGGSGDGLSLLLALFIGSRDAHSRRIAKLASPFVVFNINEILIFGLPIILNRHLLIPFIAVPFVNLLLSYWLLSLGLFSFTSNHLPWITPPFLNAYLASGGNLLAVALQIFCVLLGCAIYLPFVKRFTDIQSSSRQLRELETSLDLSAEISAHDGMRFHEAQAAIIQSHVELEEVITLLQRSRLTVYYQPKVNIRSGECLDFEALLRLEEKSGKVRGPYFLNTVELSGMASVIDFWVCRRVKQDLAVWSERGFHPTIGINLHPDTILNHVVIRRISEELKSERVEFEIIERGDVNLESARENLRHLRSCGFKVSLDDFGTGYAGFGALNNLPLDVIKLDKSLLDMTHTDKGRAIYHQVAKLSRELGLECVAEGVETATQLDFVAKARVRYVQGYFFAPALPRKKPSCFAARTLTEPEQANSRSCTGSDCLDDKASSKLQMS